MKLYYKLLLLYNFIRCFTGLYYYISDFITIVQSPYSTLIQIYFLLSWMILAYLGYSVVRILNNRVLLFMLAFQFMWGICYIGITSKPYKYICYDFGICIFIYNCFFMYQYIYNKNLQINNNDDEFNINENRLFNTVDYPDNLMNPNDYPDRLINSIEYQDL